jgi:hypothetical protein
LVSKKSDYVTVDGVSTSTVGMCVEHGRSIADLVERAKNLDPAVQPAHMDAACDKVTKLCTIASITETKRGFEATFNAKLGSFESNGKAIRATSSIAKLTDKVIFRTDKGTDGIVEWNKFQSNAAFGSFVNELRLGKGNLAGTSVVVSRIDLAHGSLEYTLNAELDANAQVLLLKRLDLSGTKFNVTFNKDKMTLTSTPAAPFVLGWRLDEIKL